MLRTIRKAAVAVAALGALALGGSAIAGAADKTSSSDTRRGGHRGGRGPGETALTGATKHVKTSADKELEVLVSHDFKVVDAREHPARP